MQIHPPGYQGSLHVPQEQPAGHVPGPEAVLGDERRDEGPLRRGGGHRRAQAAGYGRKVEYGVGEPSGKGWYILGGMRGRGSAVFFFYISFALQTFMTS